MTISDSWFQAFKKRHSELKIQKPIKRELERKKAESKEEVQSFFEKLKKIIEEKQLTPSNIWNVDESPFVFDLTLQKVK